MTKPTTFADAIPAIVDLADKQYDLIHGDASTVVETDNGPVPSAAKAVSDLNAEYAASDAIAVTRAARDAAQTDAAAAAASAAQASAVSMVIGSYGHVAATAVPQGVALNAYYWAASADGYTTRQYQNVGGAPVATGIPDGITALGVQRLGQFLDIPGYIETFTTPNGSMLRAIKDDGTFLAKLGIALGVANGLSFTRQADGSYKLSFGAAEGVIPVGPSTLNGAANIPGYLETFQAPNNALVRGAKDDGTYIIPKLDAAFMVQADSNVQYVARTVRSALGWYQIYLFNRITGTETAFAGTPGVNFVNPRFSPDGKWFTYACDAGGVNSLLAYNLAKGYSGALLSSLHFVLWGDSLTAPGSGYGDAFAPLVPARQVDNEGIGGQRSMQIAKRAGAQTCQFTVTGGSIPASGTVAVSPVATNATDDDLLGSTAAKTIQGTLNGILGTLVYSLNRAYTFTRAAAGDAVAVAGSATFQATTGLSGAQLSDLNTRIMLISGVRNDVGKTYFDLDTTAANMQSISDAANAIGAKWLQGGCINGMVDVPTTLGGMYTGTEAQSLVILNQVEAINTRFAAQFGSRFVDMLAELKALNLGYTTDFTVAGKTFSVLNANFSGTDGLHPIAAAKASMAAIFYKYAVTQKGW